MEIVLTIPDEIAAQIQNGSGEPIARRVLELTALEAYRQGLLTENQLRQMLGFTTRYQLDGFLKAHGILFDYSPTELEREAETSRMLVEKRAG
jgi:Uncharacterised protein family (UPF0175)